MSISAIYSKGYLDRGFIGCAEFYPDGAKICNLEIPGDLDVNTINGLPYPPGPGVGDINYSNVDPNNAKLDVHGLTKDFTDLNKPHLTIDDPLVPAGNAYHFKVDAFEDNIDTNGVQNTDLAEINTTLTGDYSLITGGDIRLETGDNNHTIELQALQPNNDIDITAGRNVSLQSNDGGAVRLINGRNDGGIGLNIELFDSALQQQQRSYTIETANSTLLGPNNISEIDTNNNIYKKHWLYNNADLKLIHGEVYTANGCNYVSGLLANDFDPNNPVSFDNPNDFDSYGASIISQNSITLQSKEDPETNFFKLANGQYFEADFRTNPGAVDKRGLFIDQDGRIYKSDNAGVFELNPVGAGQHLLVNNGNGVHTHKAITSLDNSITLTPTANTLNFSINAVTSQASSVRANLDNSSNPGPVINGLLVPAGSAEFNMPLTLDPQGLGLSEAYITDPNGDYKVLTDTINFNNKGNFRISFNAFVFGTDSVPKTCQLLLNGQPVYSAPPLCADSGNENDLPVLFAPYTKAWDFCATANVNIDVVPSEICLRILLNNTLDDNEVALTSNISINRLDEQMNGFVGPAGPAGAAGAIGATGAVGATGPAGANGVDGSTGATGVAGTNGADGATGATGPAGAVGATGVAGAVGATGVAGAVGATGVAGAVGATGVAGAVGATGIAGTNGTDGATGATGVAGAVGATGIQGVTGATGVQGATGPAPTITNAGFNISSGTVIIGAPVTYTFNNLVLTQPGNYSSGLINGGTGIITIGSFGNYIISWSVNYTNNNAPTDFMQIQLYNNTTASVVYSQQYSVDVNDISTYSFSMPFFLVPGQYTFRLVNTLADASASIEDCRFGCYYLI